jgi:hypothetical protein
MLEPALPNGYSKKGLKDGPAELKLEQFKVNCFRYVYLPIVRITKFKGTLPLLRET